MKKRLGQNTLFSFFSVRNEKPEPRHRAIPVFLMLIGEVVFIRMSQPLFILICLVNVLVLLILYLYAHVATYRVQG